MPDDSATTAPTPLLCLRCAYDLAGLDPGGLCPECSYAIADSTRYRGLLRDLDPRWLKRLLRGVRLLSWCSALLAVGGITMILLMLSTILLEQLTGVMSYIPSWPGSVAVVLAGASLVVTHTVACIHIGSPGPLGLPEPSPGRWGVRIAGGAFMPLSAWLFISSASASWPMWAQLVQAAVYEGVMFFYLFDLTRLFRWLEQRTPAWSPLRAQRYRETLSNLRVLVALVVLGGWVYPWLSGRYSTTGEGAMILGFLTLVIYYPLFVRIKKLLATELSNSPSAPSSAGAA